MLLRRPLGSLTLALTLLSLLTLPVTWLTPAWSQSARQVVPSPAPSSTVATETLVVDRDRAALQRYRAVLEADGQLNPMAKSPVPLKLQAEMLFDERIIGWQDHQRRAVRLYETATADVSIGGKSTQRLLSDTRRRVVYDGFADKPTVFCPTEFMRRDELELIDLPVNTSELDRLLPSQPVGLGSTWTIPTETLTMLFHIDTIVDGQIVAKLVELDAERARIEFDGQLDGHAEGAKTGMDIRGKLNFDRQTRTIRWAAVGIGENRAASANSPALRVQARLRIVVSPQAEAVQELTDAELASCDITSQADNPAQQLLAYVSQSASFQLVHDRSWHPISERTGPVIFRRIQGGRMVAQCTVSKLNRLPAGTELEMEKFQQDIRQALGKMLGSVIDAQESQSQHQLRQLRVSIAGQVSDVPMQWIYYHLSDTEGNRWALVFTCDAQQMEEFAGQDVPIVSSFQYQEESDPQTAERPTLSPR